MGFCYAKKIPAPSALNMFGSPVGKEEGQPAPSDPPPSRVQAPHPPLLPSNASLSGGPKMTK